MDGLGKILTLEDKIIMLKQKLDSIIDINPVVSDNVLELSRELDMLIVGYYNLRK